MYTCFYFLFLCSRKFQVVEKGLEVQKKIKNQELQDNYESKGQHKNKEAKSMMVANHLEKKIQSFEPKKIE